MKATEILEKTIEKYAHCSSYSDSGLVEFDGFEVPTMMRFRTRFRRPSLFTFEWKEEEPNWGGTEEYSLLWSVNGEAETIYRRGNRELIKSDPLSFAVSGASGASHGAADLIASLLMPDIGEKRLFGLKVAALQIHSESDECFILQEKRDGELDTLTLWIEKAELAIKKVDWSLYYTEEAIEEKLQWLEAEAKSKGLRPPRRDVEYYPIKWTNLFTYETVEFGGPVPV
ncbi:MAG: hypothetical protein AB7W16_12540 [Candidatus Obscuribacterales bacterium]